jgi:hypothetical protein
MTAPIPRITIVLDNVDRDAFLETLRNPPSPNEKLKELFKQYELTQQPGFSTSSILNGYYG